MNSLADLERRIRRLEDIVKRAHIVTDGKKKDIIICLK